MGGKSSSRIESLAPPADRGRWKVCLDGDCMGDGFDRAAVDAEAEGERSNMWGRDGRRDADGAKEPYASGVRDPPADVGVAVMSNVRGGRADEGWGLPLFRRFSSERFICNFFDLVGDGGPPPSCEDLLTPPPPRSIGGIGGVGAGGRCWASQSLRNEATWSCPKLVARFSGFVPCLSAFAGSAP